MKPNAFGPQTRGAPRAHRSTLIPILGVCVMLAGLSAATQYFAYTFEYHASLGWHIGFVYPPWTILQWLGKWGSYYPDQFLNAGNVGVMTTAAGLLCLLGIKNTMAQSAKNNLFPHGSARWADRKDIEAAGLMPTRISLFQRILGKPAPLSAGVYVGAWEDKKGRTYYLRHNGPEHVLCYAPTRSGKGVGLIVPTLLSWPDSAVITDLKGELWALTSGWRQRQANNKVLRFEPAAPSGGVHWNPLEEIRLGTEHEVGDVQNLATLIVDPDGKGLETHWQKSGQALLVGVILHALYEARAKLSAVPSLYDIDMLFSNPDRGVKELWLEMNQTKPDRGINYRLIASGGRDMIDRPVDERGSVLSTVKSYLSLYRDPVVRENISDSHFRIRDLMHHDNPVSLYIVTSPDDKSRLRPLVRIMMNMIVRLLAGKMHFESGRPKAHYKHRLLAMLDEFPSMGKLEILHESLAYLAGYGIKCYLVCQDISQLKAESTGYGPDESITSNCHIQTAFPPNRVETAEHLSKLAGETTVTKEQVSKGSKHSSRITTMHEIQRSLLTVDECLRMPGPIKSFKDGQDVIEKPGDMIVYAAGFPAIYGKQPLYFQEPIFQARAEIPAPAQSDRLI
ncbi:type IV secretion system protein VirD4 [Nitrosospira sp. Nsp11]|uniref:type IV secretory system conjugative DNA transfer family protein n=1 Tax=Nitrosospira sp. Nsp11 TaxID=1855338 RepID=UPI00091BB6C4|nr:type IV secretory system conjugative DNA transfer family protein [Nitrosospira sp. Nsp11]SHM13880.1 type IV secretion system protein VirD4 [Nitrosospira sp. Nsp11]